MIKSELDLIKETDIFKNCKNIVYGRGNLKADILFVGEAPGKNEDEQGLPFVGAAGKNLDKMLKEVGLSIDEIYITNILKCRPPLNRGPLPEEIMAHSPYLLKQIKEISPKVVCTLGNYATKFFLAHGEVARMKEFAGITNFHGKALDMEFFGLKIKLIPLFHPAAIIYNRSLLPLWNEDMEVVKKICK